MRTLIYKRTHSGDPDPTVGVFGNHDCMGSVKGWRYDAVIGIGGIGPEPISEGIAGRLTWVGIGPHKVYNNPSKPDNPRVTFDHFWYLGTEGPLLEDAYPALAKRLYEKNVRVMIHITPETSAGRQAVLHKDVSRILQRAMAARPSGKSVTTKTRKAASACDRKASC